MKRSLVRDLATAARGQHGLLARADVDTITGSTGAFEDLVAGEAWREVLPGVLAPAGSPSTMALVEAAAMLTDPRCVLSHHSAARRDEIWVPETKIAHVTLPWGADLRTRSDLIVTRTRCEGFTVLTDGFFRWSAPDRTVADLASLLTNAQLEAVLMSAIRREKTTAGAVAAAAVPLLRRPRTRDLLAITARWSPERESLLEDGLHADVCAAVPFFEVSRQHPVLRSDGSVQARLDVAIVDLMLAFEADGLFFHSTDEQIAADQRRDRALMARGWQVVRFREGPLSEHAAVRREVRAVVDQRRRAFRAA